MDRVRLGRALGYGTRHAAKTLAAVAEAAAAQTTQTAVVSANVGEPGIPDPGTRGRTRQARQTRRVPTAAQVQQTGRSVWGTLATFSSALWLRVTGVFFALIAFAMGNGAWRLRGAVRAGSETVGSEGAGHFWLFAGFALLFGYFAVSGFVRANLRERRTAAGR